MGNMGIMVIAVTATMFGIYFPDMGGMLFPAGGLGSYDPQLIKPPEDYRGADSMDMNALSKIKEQEGKSTTTAEAISSACAGHRPALKSCHSCREASRRVLLQRGMPDAKMKTAPAINAGPASLCPCTMNKGSVRGGVPCG